MHSNPGRAREAFLSSLAGELLSQASRVRQLIGDRHWLSDGAHKEALVRSMLDRHVPSSASVYHGFVLDPTDPNAVSREQDVLVVDTSRGKPFFVSGDFAIVTPQQVLAVISIKSAYSSTAFRSVAEGLSSVRHACRLAPDCDKILCAAYFFDSEERDTLSWIQGNESSIQDEISKHTVAISPMASSQQSLSPLDLLAFPKHLLGRRRPDESAMKLISCNGTATGHFLAIVLDHVAARYGGTSPLAEYSVF